MNWRAEVNKLQGVNSSVIGPDEIKKIAPCPRHLRPSPLPDPGRAAPPARRGRPPRRGGLGLRPCRRLHGRRDAPEDRGPQHPVRGRRRPPTARVPAARWWECAPTGVTSPPPVVVNCTAGWAGLISAMAGVRLPITTHPLQAAVTEPVKVFLPTVVVSGSLHVYISQTDRGELVFGAVGRSGGDQLRSWAELARLHRRARGPCARADARASRSMRLVRQWAGLCDITPDYSPVMGFTPVEGFLVRRRLGHVRLQGRSGVGRTDGRNAVAETAGRLKLIAPFALSPGSTRGAASRREGRRGGGALMARLPALMALNCGPRNSVRTCGTAGESVHARPDPATAVPPSTTVAGLPLPARQPGRLAARELVLPVRLPTMVHRRAQHPRPTSSATRPHARRQARRQGMSAPSTSPGDGRHDP